MSKVNGLCGPTDHRIGLINKGWSYINILVTTIALFGGIYWLGTINGWDNLDGSTYVSAVLHIIGTALTIILLHYDCLCCCCCECCLGEELVVIHDPSNPGANLVWRDGQVNCASKLSA